jgi:hypothetical protein
LGWLQPAKPFLGPVGWTVVGHPRTLLPGYGRDVIEEELVTAAVDEATASTGEDDLPIFSTPAHVSPLFIAASDARSR